MKVSNIDFKEFYMLKKIAMLLAVLSVTFSFNSLVAKESGQDGTCQGHPTCEEGDFGPSN